MSNKLLKFLTVSISCCIVSTFTMNATHAQTPGSEQKSAGSAIGQAIEEVGKSEIKPEVAEAAGSVSSAVSEAVRAAGGIAGIVTKVAPLAAGITKEQVLAQLEANAVQRTPEQILADGRANGFVISKEEEQYYVCLAQPDPEFFQAFAAVLANRNRYVDFTDPSGWKTENIMKNMDNNAKLDQDLRVAYLNLDKKCKASTANR